jgi:hypothetical protein
MHSGFGLTLSAATENYMWMTATNLRFDMGSPNTSQHETNARKKCGLKPEGVIEFRYKSMGSSVQVTFMELLIGISKSRALQRVYI